MESESIENFVELIAKVKGQHGELTCQLDKEEQIVSILNRIRNSP
jgi:hypothetical protein